MVIVETSAFTARVYDYLTDDEYRELQTMLVLNPNAGNVIRGAGGLRKVRFAPRGAGKSGGLRVIYFCFTSDNQIVLFTIYSKREVADLTPAERDALRDMMKAEVEARKK